MPPQLNPKFYQLKFRFFQAQDLSPMDIGIAYVRQPKIDAFMMVKYKNRTIKTRVITQEQGGQPIDFNQELWIPTQVPIINGRIVIKLMDQDEFFDEISGSIFYDVKDII